MVHGNNFSEYQACNDFGITTDLLEKWIAYIVNHKYIVYKDGKIKPGKRTKDRMFSSRLTDWKRIFEMDMESEKITSSTKANTYIPKNFSDSFSGYKK